MTYDDIRRVNEKIETMDIRGKKYATVAARIQAFRELYPDGIIQTDIVELTPDACTVRAWCGFFVPDDDAPRILATGSAHEERDASSINRNGSMLENCETSAIGRALGILGLGAAAVASADEVNAAVIRQDAEKSDGIRRAKISEIERAALEKRCRADGISFAKLCEIYRVSDTSELTVAQHRNINEHWDKEIRQMCREESDE